MAKRRTYVSDAKILQFLLEVRLFSGPTTLFSQSTADVILCERTESHRKYIPTNAKLITPKLAFNMTMIMNVNYVKIMSISNITNEHFSVVLNNSV